MRNRNRFCKSRKVEAATSLRPPTKKPPPGNSRKAAFSLIKTNAYRWMMRTMLLLDAPSIETVLLLL